MYNRSLVNPLNLITVFTREGRYCRSAFKPSQFCLSVCLFVTRWSSQQRCKLGSPKSSPSAAWMTLVSGTVIVKLFHKFERGHTERKR